MFVSLLDICECPHADLSLGSVSCLSVCVSQSLTSIVCACCLLFFARSLGSGRVRWRELGALEKGQSGKRIQVLEVAAADGFRYDARGCCADVKFNFFVLGCFIFCLVLLAIADEPDPTPDKSGPIVPAVPRNEIEAEPLHLPESFEWADVPVNDDKHVSDRLRLMMTRFDVSTFLMP